MTFSRNLSYYDIESFAKKLNSQETLQRVIHSPAPWSKPGTCFTTIDEVVRRGMGMKIVGWYFFFFHNPGYLVASGHAIWRSPSDELRDFTPFSPQSQPLGPLPDRVYFLPDVKAAPDSENSIAPDRYYPLEPNNVLIEQLEILCKKNGNSEIILPD